MYPVLVKIGAHREFMNHTAVVEPHTGSWVMNNGSGRCFNKGGDERISRHSQASRLDTIYKPRTNYDIGSRISLQGDESSIWDGIC